MSKALIGLAFALLTTAGCGSDPDQLGTPEGRPFTVDSAAVGPATADPAAQSAGADGSWLVSPQGAGSIRIGMTVPQLLPYLDAGVDTAGLGGDCAYAPIREAPDSTLYMVEAGRLVRIDVIGGDTPTLEGARVGDMESRILTLYPRARRGPHKYTDGFYLTVLPDAPGDTLNRYVFETDGVRVTRYRAGVFPPVEYVEGCS